MKKTFKGQIVENYLRRFPNTQSTTLAKKIYAENSEHFNTFETVRSLIREKRGLHGKAHRKSIIDKQFYVKPFSLKNPYSLPDSDAQEPKIFHLPREISRVLVISDLHIPYHDITPLTMALDYGKKQKINCIFINGDLIDFYQISRFVNLERKRSVAEELEIVKEFLGVLNKEFPNVPIYLLMGNHDMRLEKYLATKAPELLDVEEFRLKELLEADKHNLTVIEATTLVKIGKLSITHGDLLLKGFFSPVNPARGAFLKAKASVLVSHTHKVSTHTETTINGKTIVCYSTGSLCELTPAYAPFANNFMHGFAYVEVEHNGNYKVKNIQIVDGIIIN